MHAYQSYLGAIERSRCSSSLALASELGLSWCGQAFLQRGWIAQRGYLTHVPVPVLDTEQDVEVQIDLQAQVYSYRSPQYRARILQRPLADIALYAFEMDAWLADLAALMGIEQRRQPACRVCFADHLWHLGDLRIAGTHEFAPVFVTRAWERAPHSQVRAVLEDPIWPRGGIVLRYLHQQRLPISLPREHVMRGLDEFVGTDNGQDVFDASAFDRVLRGRATTGAKPEPEQFLQGTRLRLPHFAQSRVLPHKQAEIVRLMWGVQGRPAPDMSWSEVKAKTDTGCQSFDDAFGGKAEREDVIAMVKRGRYRLRRNT